MADEAVRGLSTAGIATAATDDRRLHVLGTDYRVMLPSLRDPRMHVAAVIVSVQVLGQVVLDFNVSVAQILLTIGLCAAIEIPMAMWDKGVIAWPASALLTGNGIALLLRTPGTEHGDWWSLNGWPVFVAAAVVAMFSKYAVRYRERHIFNPSNLGLVTVFLLFGSAYADPQELWWGPWSPGLVATVALIVLGGITLSRRLGLFDLIAAFWLTFAAGISVLALAGHSMTARWSLTPVAGVDYVWILLTSPEIIIFAFFMITDPPTSPKTARARIAYAVGIGALAALLSATQGTEFGTKVSLLAALTLICATRPLLERWLPDVVAEVADLDDRPPGAAPSLLRPSRLALFAMGWVVLLVVLSNNVADSVGRSGDSTTVVAEGAAGSRPAVDMPADAVPEATIRDNVLRGAVVDGGESQQVVTDLVEALVVESEALRTGDIELARTASFGPRLVQIDERMQANEDSDRVEQVDYELDSAEVVLLRDPVSPQSIPQLGVELSGTETVTAFTDRDATRVDTRESQEFRRVYLVTEVDGTYMIGADMAADAPMVTGR